MIYNDALEAMQAVPLIRLRRMTPAGGAQILVKYEALNPGGSIKTITAYNMILDAERRGLIGEGSVIVEPTSGNQGIGLALAGAVRGYETVVIMPDSASVERRALIKHYGAKVKLVHDEGNIGECMAKCVEEAKRAAEENEKVFVPQQFENPANVDAHRRFTAREIIEQAGVPIDGFCSGVGTGGTITGVGEELKARYPDVLIWAVEPENAAILSGGSAGTHLQTGIGDGIIPKILNKNIYEEVCIISDGEAIKTARDLARLEGLTCGISSGTNVAAAKRMSKKLGEGKTVATVLPDAAERYFSTPLFDE